MKRIKFLSIVSGVVSLFFVYTLNAQAFIGISAKEASAKQINDGDIQKIKSPEYVEGKLIVELKEGKTCQDIRDLNNKYNVSSTEEVFKQPQDPKVTLLELKGKLSGLNLRHDSWYWQIDKDSREYKDYQAKIEKEKENLQKQIHAMEEFIGRLEQRQKRAPEGENAPDLRNTFVLETARDTDISAMAAEYSSHDAVKYAQPAKICRALTVPNDPYYSSSGAWGQNYDDLWGLKKLSSEKAWDVSEGDGVIVAVVDTGVDSSHEDIKDNIWINTGEIPDNGIDDDGNGYIDDTAGWNFVNMNNNPSDGYGHGTHCAGTIAAVGNNNIGIIGVAPKSEIMAIKGLDNSGSGSDADLAKCIYYAVNNGASVISNSWGGSGTSKVLENAVNYAYSRGCVILAAAGNDNLDVVNDFPANLDNVIAVAATDQNDNKCSFSNFGYKIDVSAPGGGENESDPYNILSLLAKNSSLSNYNESLIVGTNYLRLAGTSMACPHVSGLAALLIDKYPSEKNKEIKKRIVVGADSLPDNQSFLEGRLGSGRINAYNSLVSVKKPYCKIKDISIKEISGDGDQIPEEGEKIALTLTLENVGNKNVTYASGDIITSSPEIQSIIKSHSAFGKIPQDYSAGNAKNPFIFQVGAIQYETPVYFSVTINADGIKQDFRIKLRLGVSRLTNKGYNYAPAIYKKKAAYIYDDTNSIYLLDLDTRQKRLVATVSEGLIESLSIYGDKIVWVNVKYGTYGITWSYVYMFDILSGKTTRVSKAESVQRFAHIYGDRIVWSDMRNGNYGDIYMYDISTRKEKRITSGDYTWADYPRVFEDKILYRTYTGSSSTGAVYMLDLTKNETKKIAEAVFPYSIYNPRIYRNRVIWQLHNGQYGNSSQRKIMLRDLDSQEEKVISENSTSDMDIYGNTVIFTRPADGSSVGLDNIVYLYDLSSGKEQRITASDTHRILNTFNPGLNIYGDKVCWVDYSDSYLDIYLAKIADNTAPTGTIRINKGSGTTTSKLVTLYLSAQDDESGMDKGAQMCFSNDVNNWTRPEAYRTSKTWFLPAQGVNTVYVKFKDVEGNWSQEYSAEIFLKGAGGRQMMK